MEEYKFWQNFGFNILAMIIISIIVSCVGFFFWLLWSLSPWIIIILGGIVIIALIYTFCETREYKKDRERYIKLQKLCDQAEKDACEYENKSFIYSDINEEEREHARKTYEYFDNLVTDYRKEIRNIESKWGA